MIRPFGERALLVEVDRPEQGHALAASVASAPVAGIEAVVPALDSVLVELDAAGSERVDAVVDELARRLVVPTEGPGTGRVRTVPVAYGGEHGPDLDDTAALLGMSPGALARRHAGTEVSVLFCGFAPGFAYLGELPVDLQAPRLVTPRTRTPSGSVALAGSTTGIYPTELPGGWRVIGRTPLILFDHRRDPPAYLAPGDTVRWQPMDPAGWPETPTTADDW